MAKNFMRPRPHPFLMHHRTALTFNQSDLARLDVDLVGRAVAEQHDQQRSAETPHRDLKEVRVRL